MVDPAQNLQAVERSIDAVTAIRQVVGAVWTLARAQQRRVEYAAGEGLAYLRWVQEFVARFAVEDLKEAGGGALWVVLGPERPFCGGLARRLIEQVPSEGALLLVGRRLADAVPLEGAVRGRVVASLSGAASPEEIDSSARRVAAKLLEIEHEGPIGLLYPIEGGTTLTSTLLVGAVPRSSGEIPETYSAVTTVLSAAMQEAVSGRLVLGSAEALRSEVRARLIAADAARQGCDRELEGLRRQWRVQRQEAITSELLELYSGHLVEEDGESPRSPALVHE